MKAFISSHFCYCPVVWMFHRKKKLGIKTNTLHANALRVTHGDKTSSFNELLEKNNS